MTSRRSIASSPSRPPRELRTGRRYLLDRFFADEAGQDIVEYALLAALIGIAAILIWQQLVTTVGVVYGNADTGTQTLSACTPDPGGGGCP